MSASVIEVVFEDATDAWVVARAAQQGSATLVEYTDEHLARDVELAPISHPNTNRSRTFDRNDVGQLPGLLADTVPDSWGQLLLRRDMRQHGIENPSSVQMLTWLGRRTMGALTFRPVEGPTATAGDLIDLDRLQDEMLRHLAGEATHDEAAAALTLAAGSGPGGARPKITVAYTPDGNLVADAGTDLPAGSTPWMVKFHAHDDSVHQSTIEATYLQMAARSGLTVCDHHLLISPAGTRYLAVRRFDRTSMPGSQPARNHMASAAGLLERYPEHDQHVGYDDLIRLTRRVTGDVRDVAEMVRRAVFNVVAHNRDDHARNTAYLWSASHNWQLAPAFDLTHSMGPRPAFLTGEPGEHYLDIAGKGKGITRADLHSLAAASGLSTGEIDDMIDAAVAAVADWAPLATANGLPPNVIDEVAERLPALDA